MVVSGRGPIVGCVLLWIWGTSAFLWTVPPAFLSSSEDEDDEEDDEDSGFNMDDLDSSDDDELDDEDIDEDMESFLGGDDDDEEDFMDDDENEDDLADVEEEDLMEVLNDLRNANEDDDDDSDVPESDSDADATTTTGARQVTPVPSTAETGEASGALASDDKDKEEANTVVVSATDMPTGKVQWKHLSTYDSSVLSAPPTEATEQYEGNVPSLVNNAPALNTTRISSRGDIFGDVQAFWARIGISYRNMTHEKETFLQERKAAYHDRLKHQREKYRRGLNDTGSPEYQVAGLTERINYLAAHLVENPKDFAAERGLVALVNKRRRHLNYLYKEDNERYKALISSLNIRHRPPGAQRFDRALKYATFPPQNPKKLQLIKKKKKKKKKGKK
eukprot:Nitzschia sp. Nitz4//scaffold143_size57137//19597//21099//NITZ4_006512-RA/size57137-augustus-gene-0.90-mRNA-1//1//CDS//3329536440//3111//frame0